MTHFSGEQSGHSAVEPVAAIDPAVVRQRRLVLWTAISANLLGNVGLTGINVAIPAIQRDFLMSAPQAAWVTLSAMLAMAAFSAPVARLSDLVGRRRVTIIGLLVSIIGSLGGAMSQSLIVFFVFRALTGVGLVAFFTTVTTMITAVYPKEQRGRVLGLSISSVYTGLSLGPVLSGFMVQWWGWSSLFWFTAIGLLPSLILINMVKTENVTSPDEKLDLSGAFLWMMAVLLGFTGLASLGKSFSVPAVLLGVVFLALFLRHSYRSKSPLLDLKLFLDSRRFTFSSLAAFISYMSSFSLAFLLSLYLQYSKGLSPSEAGLMLTVQPLFQAIITPISGRLSDRFDPGYMASFGLCLILVATLIFAFNIRADTSTYLLLSCMALFGTGFAFFSAPNSNAIMSAVPPRRLGQASGVITVTRLCGQISSNALTTLVFSLVIGSGAITPDKYPAFVTATSLCFKIFAPLCLLGILASLARGRRDRI